MFQTTKMPVKVYRGTDPEAPQLSTTAGSLKTLLKACLVTGYGTNENRKEPLGWAMPFEEPFKAAFHSQDETSNRHYLTIDNINASYATAIAFLSVDSTGKGTGLISEGNGYDYFAYNSSNANKWLLVGHEKAFVLMIPDGDGRKSQILFFGDVPSLVAGDVGQTLYLNTNYSSTVNYDNGTIDTNYSPFKLALNAGGAAPYTKAIRVEPYSLFLQDNITYPNPLTGGLNASEIYLRENKSVRCLWSGFLACANNLQDLFDGETIALGDGQEWVKLNLHDNGDGAYCFLLNLTAWEA